MVEWISAWWQALTWTTITVSVGLFVLSFCLSIIIVAIVIVKIPANYFSSHYRRDFLPNSGWFTRWGVTIIKNLVGAVLVLAGIVMLIGPGQGILTILIGLVMMDIPGKRPLEARIIKRPAVLSAVNNLRARWGKPPLEVD